MFIRRKELDAFLIESLKNYYSEIEDCYRNYPEPKFELDFEIKEDYKECLAILDDILKKVNCIADLSDLNEDEIDFVYQCLALYEGIFIISHQSKEIKKRDERNHKKLMKLINLFY